VPEVLSDPHVLARGMVQELPHPGIPDFKVVGLPVHLSETPGEPLSAPPALGQHTAAVLEELGYDPAEIEKLRAQGIV
jgi:crotonobetainyl-CoA:carnitine CoA-transferase CaiB-like acyl-CoA transferase